MAASQPSRPGEREIREWMEIVLPEIYRSLISAQCRRAEFQLSGDSLLFLESEYFIGWRDSPLRLHYERSRFIVSISSIIDDLIRDDAFVYAWDDAGRVDKGISWLDMDRYDLGQWIRSQLDLRVDQILASLGNRIHAAARRGECTNFDVIISGLIDWGFHGWKSGPPPSIEELRNLAKWELDKKSNGS